uniref:hypothetical protein n=1 Tax=Pedobacter schmidteae TaxID=2201271 RepID=UPI000EAC099D|nr:hypothetical protein [Pedobacter schmidteae]
MKKILSIVLPLTITVSAYSQNTFPSSGNAGAGTLTPSQQLTVKGNLNIEDPTGGKYIGFGVPGVNEYNSIGSLYSSAVLALSHGLKPHGNQGALVYSHPEMSRSAITIGGYSETGIKFYTKDVTGETVGAIFNDAPRMMISNNGNVGIGTTNPLQKFVVSNNNADGLEVYLNQPTGLVGLQAYNRTTSSYSKMQFDASHFSFSIGNVGIGTTDSQGYRLAVNGNIKAREIKVDNTNWPDYVFSRDYQLPTLQETEKHIKDKGHLPGIPTAAEVKANGIDLGEMNAKLLQKIEELTLHLIEKDKEIKALLKDVATLKKDKSN